MPIVTTSPSRRPKRSPVLPTAIAAVAIAVAVAIYLGARAARQPQPLSVSDTTTSPPLGGPTSAADAAPTSPMKPAQPQAGASAPPPQAATTNNYVKRPGQMMLPNGQILTFTPPEPGTTTRVTTPGHIYECDSEGNWKDITPQKPFDNPVENSLVGLSMENGKFIPAFMLNYSDEEIMAALRREVVINQDDPEDVKLKKQAVAEMKAVILDYMEQGGTYRDFVYEMAAYVKAERKVKAAGIHKIVQLVKAGDIEGAKAYREELDKVLESQEFTKIRLPKHVAEAFGE